MRKTDLMTIAGLVGGTILIIISMAAGGNLGLFWNLPSVGITIGGSFAAMMVHYDLDRLKSIFKTVRLTFTTSLMNPQELIDLFGELAKKARREGLLGLEDDMYRLDDPFFQKGIQMMVDAIDPELIRNILETDMDYMAARHESGAAILKTWATLAPAFGMIGTLIGLIQMLASLDDPSALGPGMAVALITTFYGAIMANFVFIPLAGKLDIRSQEELLLKSIMLEGIIGIQSGMNPRILEEKLKAFLPNTIEKEGPVAKRQEGVALDA
ncbi:motility protein A [Zhaonella formicivorans]|uniref:motility protein A n=1 Tax=Zhaonella formicivorans TaxID=2528593 RepID=UPI0010EE12FF|nr:MotA/TolQ/ExbB proton channel family protein [Zhaonella formicivorans]